MKTYVVTKIFFDRQSLQSPKMLHIKCTIHGRRMHVQIEFNGQQYRLEFKILNVLKIWKFLFSNASKIFDT